MSFVIIAPLWEEMGSNVLLALADLLAPLHDKTSHTFSSTPFCQKRSENSEINSLRKTNRRFSRWETGVLKDWTLLFFTEEIIGSAFPCFLTGRLFRIRETKTVYKSEIGVIRSINHKEIVPPKAYVHKPSPTLEERCPWGPLGIAYSSRLIKSSHLLQFQKSP